MTFEKINVGAGTVTPTYVNCNCSNATNATKNFSTSHGHCSNKSKFNNTKQEIEILYPPINI